MKLFIFAILAIVAVSADTTCEPGKSFKSYCNTCTCGADGVAETAACTKMECVPRTWNPDGTLIQPLSDPIPRDKRQTATCNPGSSFKRYCNTCTCGADGLTETAVCTEMDCVPFMWNPDGTLAQPLSDPIPRNKRQTATCEPGSSFKNYCNSCTCGADGLTETAVCTKMDCVPFMWNPDGTLAQPLSDPIPRNKRQTATCEPGSSFKNYCNTCTCGADGLTETAVCTKMDCVPFMWNPDGTLAQPLSDPIPRNKRQTATCEPGSSFKSYCNTCTCGADGLTETAVCTQMDCVPFMWNPDGTLAQPLSDPIPRNKRQTATCEPGSSFKNYCNTCTCGADGLTETAVCTKMDCVPFMWNPDGTLAQPLSDPIPRNKRQTATCEPGSSFKNYCNSCTCGADGLTETAVCTKMDCVPFMWNPDGTLAQPLSDPIPRNKRQTATCEPGSSFKSYCNTCTCGADGLTETAVCTKMDCVPFMWNPDGTLAQPLSDPIPRNKRQTATCKPGSSFKMFCNTCYCPESGSRDMAYCTMIGCPEGVYKEDGSLIDAPRDQIRKN